jgi:hypothetical protein
MRFNWIRPGDHTSSRQRLGLWAAVAVTVTVVGAIGCRPSASLPRADAGAAWARHVHAVDQALAEGDVGTAVRARDDAYTAARASRRWEGMIEVGDRYLQVGKVAGLSSASIPKARKMYLLAFFRARSQGAVDGMVHAAEAFGALGDTEPALLMTKAALAAGLQAPARQASAP